MYENILEKLLENPEFSEMRRLASEITSIAFELNTAVRFKKNIDDSILKEKREKYKEKRQQFLVLFNQHFSLRLNKKGLYEHIIQPLSMKITKKYA